MITKSKIERIEKLNVNSFKELTLLLLEKIGYDNIESNEKSYFIRAKEKGALKTNQYVFYVIGQFLSGVSEKTIQDEILDNIKTFSQEHGEFSFFIFSNSYISKGFQNKLSQKASGFTLDFKGRDEIIQLIERYFPDYWKHEDKLLIEYEKQYLESIKGDLELKKLKIFNEKYDKVLNIFIEPHLFSIHQDKETNKPIRKRTSLSQIGENKKPKIIIGNPGAGKSTLLKKIGENLIDGNKSLKKKNIPILVTPADFYENEYNLENIINNKINSVFSESFEDLCSSYSITVLIDSIDELAQDYKKAVIEKLDYLYKNFEVTYLLGTRNVEKLLSENNEIEYDQFRIDKFNSDQIKRYVQSFFPKNENKAENLLDALRDNRILERLPITPLTLSLISILYEEKNFEIPATIADIYENFHTLLVGKATVSSRLEFIDISFSERILSIYAFELLNRRNLTPFSREEFINFFENYFEEKKSALGKDQLHSFLNHITDNSGILVIKDGKYIQFQHNSFLEYYSAREYFYHRRNDEDSLVNNFFDPIWQNTAVFYGGMSKDMPDFLNKIIDKVNGQKNINDSFSSVIGLGYILQALYQTNNEIRKMGIKSAIEANIDSFETLKKLASENKVLFRNHNLPLLTLINLLYFFDNFNSLALKHPLSLAFSDYYNDYLKNPTNTNSGYRALKIALTLNSTRLSQSQYLEDLIFKTEIVKNPQLSLIASFAMSLNEGSSGELKKELEKNFIKNRKIFKELIGASLKKLRFSPLDGIYPNKNVTLIVEGETDHIILEHAYMVLTNGKRPYWNIKIPQPTQGAKAVCDVIVNNQILNKDEEYIIGILDNDSKGIAEFNRSLKTEGDQALFEFFNDDKKIKKIKGKNLFVLRLPLPSDMQHYYNVNQELNFFEIEHMLPLEFLRSLDTLKESGINGVFIIQGKKPRIASEVIKIKDKNFFKNFIDLFKLIDYITDHEGEYEIED